MLSLSIISLLPVDLQPDENQGDDFQKLVAVKILHLLRSNQDKLFSLLYQIDLDEAEAKDAFTVFEDTLISEKLASLIFNRLQQKIKTRERYS